MKRTRRTVLHVDDDPQLLRIMAKRLSSAGYETISLDDPAQAIDSLLENDCRVALLDIDMPTINGLELLSQIKKYDGGMQVIMLTGLVSTSNVLESLRRGAEACLFKPANNFEPLLEVLGATFAKLDRWWHTLAELHYRRQQESLN